MYLTTSVSCCFFLLRTIKVELGQLCEPTEITQTLWPCVKLAEKEVGRAIDDARQALRCYR